MAKTPCPISRQEFKDHAQPVTFEIAGTPVTADWKEFSTGSFGWYFSGKVTVDVNGKKLPVQVGCNMTIVGSKAAPGE